MEKYFFILFISFFLSCISSGDSDILGNCLKNIELDLYDDELSLLKEKQGSELIKYIRFDLGKRISKEVTLIKDECPLDRLLENKGIKEERYKFIAVFMVIHYRLNKIEVDFSKINNEILAYYNNENEKELRGYEKKIKNARLNYDRFNIGDTICLLFPYEFDSLKNRRWVPIYEQVYHRGILEWSDTLNLKGILVDKSEQEFGFEEKYMTYYFQIKPFFLSKDENIYSTERLNKNNPFELKLNSYPPQIEDCL